MIRTFDILFSCLGLVLFFPLMIILAIVGLFDTGAPLYFQQRVGRLGNPFTIVKFRTMRLNTPSVATHEANAASVTAFGKFLRHTKLDELPQLWNVLLGDMSIVGPRPCLFSQKELIEKRTSLGVLDVRPGITGLGQINKIDMSQPHILARVDKQMIDSLTLKTYLLYIVRTLTGKGFGDRIK